MIFLINIYSILFFSLNILFFEFIKDMISIILRVTYKIYINKNKSFSKEIKINKNKLIF